MSTSAPALPDASALADLDPGVAFAFLGVVALAMLLFYFGGALRERIRTPKPSPPPAVEQATPAPPALPAALDRSDQVADQYIAFMREQVATQQRRIDALEREADRLRSELDRLRWRGNP